MPDGRGEEEFRQSRGEAVLLLHVGFLSLFFLGGGRGSVVGGLGVGFYMVLHGRILYGFRGYHRVFIV